MKWSKIVSAIEQLIYICPTLGTVFYYYFAELQEKMSPGAKYTFSVALLLLALFIIYRKIMKTKIDELRQSVVQTETDLKNEPDSNHEKREILAKNAAKDRLKLDMYDRGALIVSLLILALSVYVLERAAIGLTNIVFISVGSILAGSGLHIGVIKLRQKEAVRK